MKKLIYFICLTNLIFTISSLKNNLNISKDSAAQCGVKYCLKCIEGSDKKCSSCVEDYILNDGKCFSKEGLKFFIDSLKNSATPKELSVLDYIMRDMNLGDNPDDISNVLNIQKFKTLSKDFNSIREILKKFQTLNERECRMKINQFVVDFEQNIQVLLSLANLFEQRTIFEIEKKRNNILSIINSDLKPNTKLELVTDKLDDLNNIITTTFQNIKDKILAYQDISEKKIARAKNSFIIKIKKFLK